MHYRSEDTAGTSGGKAGTETQHEAKENKDAGIENPFDNQDDEGKHHWSVVTIILQVLVFNIMGPFRPGSKNNNRSVNKDGQFHESYKGS